MWQNANNAQFNNYNTNMYCNTTNSNVSPPQIAAPAVVQQNQPQPQVVQGEVVGSSSLNLVETNPAEVSMKNTTLSQNYEITKKKQRVEVLNKEINKFIKYPFPFRFKLYSKAIDCYTYAIKLIEKLPKSIKSTFGVEMVRTYKNLARAIDRTNNEPDIDKRIKGWKNCHELVNSTSADLVVCIKNGYIEKSKMSFIIRSNYEINKMLLKLISVEVARSMGEVNKKGGSNDDLSESISMLIEDKYSNGISMVTNEANYPAPTVKDPCPNVTITKAQMVDQVLAQLGCNGNNPMANMKPQQSIETQPKSTTSKSHFFSKSNVSTHKKCNPNPTVTNSYAKQYYNTLANNIAQYNANMISTLPISDGSANLMRIKLNDELVIQNMYNNAIMSQPQQPNTKFKSVVVKDYFHKERIDKFNGDIAKAQRAFCDRIVSRM